MRSIVFLSLLLCFSCSSVESPSGTITFDRKAFLTAYADNFILPGFRNLEKELIKFNATFASSTLERVYQNQWLVTYKAFLEVTAFNFGPAEEALLKKSFTEEVATFPINISALESKVMAGQTAFNDFQRDTRGFLALEYLLFATHGLEKEKVRDYVLACLQNIIKQTQEIVLAWEGYRVSFINNDGTSVGSSTSSLYNEFVKSYEGLKNFKIGIPLGLRAGLETPMPQRAEAPYSGYSEELAEHHFKSLVRIYRGTTGFGFVDYLNTVVGGKELVLSTENQIKTVENIFEAVKLESIDSAGSGLEALHTELQKLTRFFKSEMSSVLGISITYSSGDGD